jgi:hemerythrin
VREASVPYIEWDTSLSVGVDELDQQHRHFMQVLNYLHDRLLRAPGHELLEARRLTIEGLQEYVDEHFAAEERYMHHIGYPDLPRHRRLHEEFTARVRGFRSAMEGAGQLLSSELMKELLTWFHQHLTTEDRKYRQYAASRPQNAT